MLDDTSWFSPFIETYTCERLPWATTPAVHSFPTFPDFSAYEPLVREYAETLAGPLWDIRGRLKRGAQRRRSRPQRRPRGPRRLPTWIFQEALV
jgi:hypothetical protein